jgi:hypothetical protein
MIPIMLSTLFAMNYFMSESKATPSVCYLLCEKLFYANAHGIPGHITGINRRLVSRVYWKYMLSDTADWISHRLNCKRKTVLQNLTKVDSPPRTAPGPGEHLSMDFPLELR